MVIKMDTAEKKKKRAKNKKKKMNTTRMASTRERI